MKCEETSWLCHRHNHNTRQWSICNCVNNRAETHTLRSCGREILWHQVRKTRTGEILLFRAQAPRCHDSTAVDKASFLNKLVSTKTAVTISQNRVISVTVYWTRILIAVILTSSKEASKIWVSSAIFSQICYHCRESREIVQREISSAPSLGSHGLKHNDLNCTSEKDASLIPDWKQIFSQGVEFVPTHYLINFATCRLVRKFLL